MGDGEDGIVQGLYPIENKREHSCWGLYLDRGGTVLKYVTARSGICSRVGCSDGCSGVIDGAPTR